MSPSPNTLRTSHKGIRLIQHCHSNLQNLTTSSKPDQPENHFHIPSTAQNPRNSSSKLFSYHSTPTVRNTFTTHPHVRCSPFTPPLAASRNKTPLAPHRTPRTTVCKLSPTHPIPSHPIPFPTSPIHTAASRPMYDTRQYFIPRFHDSGARDVVDVRQLAPLDTSDVGGEDTHRVGPGLRCNRWVYSSFHVGSEAPEL